MVKIKDETLLPEAKKSLHLLFSDNLYDWNVPFSDAISWSWVEGPAVTKLGNDRVVYFDQYRKGKFGALKSKICFENRSIGTTLRISTSYLT